MLARYCSYLGRKREGSETVVVEIRKSPCEVPVCLKIWVRGVSMAIRDAVSIVTLAPPVNFFDARWVRTRRPVGRTREVTWVKCVCERGLQLVAKWCQGDDRQTDIHTHRTKGFSGFHSTRWRPQLSLPYSALLLGRAKWVVPGRYR